MTVDADKPLTPVKAFWWRCFIAHHKAMGNEDRLEAVLPVVSSVAAMVQTHATLAVSDPRFPQNALIAVSLQ